VCCKPCPRPTLPSFLGEQAEPSLLISVAVLARLLQGVANGRREPTTAAYVTETAPTGRRGLYGAISYGRFADAP
jgi:MFS family permease